VTRKEFRLRGLQVSVSDPAELSSLQSWLIRVPDTKVERVAQPPQSGEQGVWDVLTILASGSGVLAVAIRTLPDFLRARRSTVSIKVKVKDREVVLTAANVEDVLPAILKALDD
jgi:hypothetical protein